MAEGKERIVVKPPRGRNAKDDIAVDDLHGGPTYIIYRSVPVGGVTIGDGEFPPEIVALEEIVEALKQDWSHGALKPNIGPRDGGLHDRIVFEIPGRSRVKVLLGDFADNPS